MVRSSVLALSAALASAQDPYLANSLLRVSDAVYCGDSQHGGLDSIVSWTCPACTVTDPVQAITTFEDPVRQTMGIAGITSGWKTGEQIIVSMRGSVLLMNFVDDVDDALVTVADRRGRVYRGLHRSYMSLRDKMLAAVASLRTSHPQAKGILVTGHSLGAAQAVYAADDLAAAHPDMKVTMYSFGTFRPGDLDFAQRLNATANLETWAVAHRGDPVAQYGDRSKGYHQISRNIWYPEDLGQGSGPENWIICDGSGEDPKCQDSVPSSKLVSVDHNYYLNHSMWCCDDQSTTGAAPGKGCSFPFSSSVTAALV